MTAADVRVEVVGTADLADLARMRVHWSTGQPNEPDPEFAGQFANWWAGESGERVGWIARAPGGRAVGMANAAIFTRMPRPGCPAVRWAYVANVWVAPDHRRRGVGRALMDVLLDWARTENMQRVVLNPSEISLPLYRSVGFRPADDLLLLELI